MKTVQTACVLVIVGMLVLAGCDSKPTHDSVMKDSISSMNDMTAILKDVKDEASAKAAAPKLKAIKEKMDATKKQADAMPKPTKEQEDALKKKYEPEMKKAMEGFMAEMMRVGLNPQTGPALKEALPSGMR